MSTTRSMRRRSGCASPSTMRAWSSTASRSRPSTTRSRPSSAASASAIPTAARAPARSRSPSGCRRRRCSLSERLLATPVPAPGPAGGQPRVVELGDLVTLQRETGVLSDLPARRPRRRDGHGGTGRRASRRRSTACSRSPTRSARQDWGGARPAAIRLAWPARRRSRGRQLPVGRRVGDHLCHLPRHGRGLRRRACSGSICSSSPSSAASSCRSLILMPVPLTLDRHRARALAASARRSPRLR